ncbi:hypothetical protein BOTCAL_0287g00180 [Botryotinia calthae]|uniref:Uncharacterized protein n=1 Tax=Botryotinia calthae TaxID=38488 RepID=A0A4Y8CXN3_9HELO|nr:hypothetical protein BOTCAL_0287g00180 [Botryotinia calthae]
MLDILYKKVILPVANSTGNISEKDIAELGDLLQPVEKLLGKLEAPKMNDFKSTKDLPCDVDKQVSKDKNLAVDDSIERHPVADFILIMEHHEDPIRPLNAPNQPSYLRVDEQTAFDCFPFLRLFFGNSTRPIDSHVALHGYLFFPPTHDDHIVFDTATTMVTKLLWDNKIIYIEEFLRSDLAKSQKSYADGVHEDLDNLVPGTKNVFSGSGNVENIGIFIDRVLALAKFLGAVVNEIEDPKTMFILCWWSCHGRPFSTVVSLDSSLERSAPTTKIWNVQKPGNSIQAELNKVKNTKIRFIDTMPESLRREEHRIFIKAKIFRKLPLLQKLYSHKRNGSLGDLADNLVYDPDISAQKKEDYHYIGIYSQALMRSQFMKDQPGYTNVTTSTGRIGRAFTNLGTWAEGLTLRRLSSRDFQDLTDLAVFLGVKNASYDLFVYQNNDRNNANEQDRKLNPGV